MLFARPRGGLQVGKGLRMIPKLRRESVGCPAKILFISDLHLRPEHPEMADTLIKVCTGTEPDLVCLGGDMAEYDEGLEICLQRLRQCFESVPILAVPGNNDDGRLGSDREAQAELYRKYGAEYLLNDSRLLTVRDRRIRVAGIEDAYTHEPDFGGLFPPEEDAFRVLLAHEPLGILKDCAADLCLCGHTHGGQINVLGLTCYLLLNYEKRFALLCLAGKKKIGRTTFLVSRGIGYSKYPIRFGARSEIHFVT